MQPPSINSAVAALRFFFTVTLDRPDLARRLTIVREPRRLPAVLSVEEVTLLFEAAPGPKYKAALGTAYGAGLRVSEVVALKVGDIDSERMLLRVEQGKGRKDRHAMLSPQLLELPRTWWREGGRRGVLLPRGWLFPGRARLTDPSALWRGDQLFGASDGRFAGGTGEQSVVADAMEPLGQDVEQEASDEFAGHQRHRAVPRPSVAAVVLEAEGDATVASAAATANSPP